MKKIIIILCICLFGLGFVYSLFNANSTNTEVFHQSVDINNDTTRDITFEEMVNEISKNEGCAYEKVENRFITNQRNTLLAQRSTDGVAYTDQEIVEMLSRASYATGQVNIFSKNIKYVAGLELYFSYTGSVPHRYIQQLLYVGMNTDVASTHKSYCGDVYVNLESTTIIHYIVNGAFYDTAVTTVGADVNIGNGDSANLHFGVFSSKDIYDSIYAEGRWYTSR